jgi:hypothetical protein
MWQAARAQARPAAFRQSLPTSISDIFDNHDERQPSTFNCSFFGFGCRRASDKRSFGKLI